MRSASKAVVYAYRPYSIFGAALRPDVTCGSESSPLGPVGYHAFTVEPGTVTCHARTEATSEVDVPASVGRANYVRSEIRFGILIGRPKLTLVDEHQAEGEIRACHLQ